jgi:hypothetical protein
MKKAFMYTPVVLSFVILAAHFMRYGNFFLLFVTLLLPVLLFVRKPWAARVIQAALLLGVFEWAHTLYELVQMRAAQGQPYGRMLAILGVVAAMTFCSALLFQSKTFRRTYGFEIV